MPKKNSAPAASFVASNTPTLGDRLKRLQQTIVTMEMFMERQDVQADDLSLVDILTGMLCEAHEQLYWLSQFPEFVRALPAPDDDQCGQDGDVSHEENHEAAARAYFQRQLSGRSDGMSLANLRPRGKSK